MKKRAFSFLLLPFLVACSESHELFPFGEEVDREKPYVLFRSFHSEGEDYEQMLPSLSSEVALDLLKNGECLSLFLEAKTCEACKDIFPTFKEVSKELNIETFSMTSKEAKKLLSYFPFLEKTTFSKGTPGWYLLTQDKVQEVLYGTTRDKEALKRKIKTTFFEFVSLYNAYRIDSFEIWNEKNKDFSTPTLIVDRSDSESGLLFKRVALPFFEKNKKPFFILDTSFFEECEQTAIKEFFIKDEKSYPIRFKNSYISFQEAPSYFNSLLE